MVDETTSLSVAIDSDTSRVDASVDDPDESTDQLFQAWRERTDADYLTLRHQARAGFRAMTGWEAVESEDAWLALCDTAVEDYQSGRFLIERLGAERFLDPGLMATLLMLRQELLRGLGAHSAHEYLLVDMALLSYHHLLRFNGW